MTHSPYLLFHQTPEQLRRIGARGGKAQARNRREGLRGQRPTQSDIIVYLPRPQQTTANAIAELDTRFPWLSGAERRHSDGAVRP